MRDFNLRCLDVVVGKSLLNAMVDIISVERLHQMMLLVVELHKSFIDETI